MHSNNSLRSLIASSLLCVAALIPQTSFATIVEVETNLGEFQINLYDNATPLTVANFLAYVQNGDFSDSVFHRSVSAFIVQGGAVVTDGNAALSAITTRPSVTNEPVYSNVRGTIAMAKLGSSANSSTSQLFFNLGNNASNLDNQNGGFTAFGEVISGMDVVDAIAAVPTFNGVSGFNDFPLQNYTAPDAVVNDNYVIVTEITVIDTTVDSAAGLNPTATTRNTGGGNGGGGGGGGGGSVGLLAIFGLLVFGRRRYGLLKTA